LCSEGIKHLASEEILPRMNKSTTAVLRRILFMKENHEPLSPEAVFAFSDIKNMYDNVDCNEALDSVKARLEPNPSSHGLSAEFLAEGLKICLDCNCVQFKGKFYIPFRGCAQGTKAQILPFN
jgi:hypothetical protein